MKRYYLHGLNMGSDVLRESETGDLVLYADVQQLVLYADVHQRDDALLRARVEAMTVKELDWLFAQMNRARATGDSDRAALLRALKVTP